MLLRTEMWDFSFCPQYQRKNIDKKLFCYCLIHIYAHNTEHIFSFIYISIYVCIYIKCMCIYEFKPHVGERRKNSSLYNCVIEHFCVVLQMNSNCSLLFILYIIHVFVQSLNAYEFYYVLKMCSILKFHFKDCFPLAIMYKFSM